MRNLTVPDVLPLVRALYESEDGACGCCLHIVLDDDNIEDGHVEWSMKYALERGHGQCYALGLILLTMSKTQRLRLAAWRRWAKDS